MGLRVIFIVGSSRSGTTMTARLIGTNPAVFALNELHFFEQEWQESDAGHKIGAGAARDLLLKLFSTQRDGYFFRHLNERYAAEAASLMARHGVQDGTHEKNEIFSMFVQHEARRVGKSRWCEQTPRNIYYVDAIHRLFPDARFVHVLRDPRDVLLSQKNRWKRRKFNTESRLPLHVTVRQWLNYHPITILKLWVGATHRAAAYAKQPNFRVVKYEDLLARPEQTVRDLCAFLGLTYNGEMLDVPQVGSSLGLDRPEARGMNASKIGGWRKGGLSAAEVHLCERIAGPLMRAFGYEVSGVKPGMAVLGHYLSFPVKLGLALPFSLNRIGNLGEAIRRRL